MTAVDTPPTELELLAEKAEDLADRMRRPVILQQARAMLNEAGLTAARRRLSDGLDRLGNTQITLREKQEAERQAKEKHDQAVVAAEWSLAPCFEVRSNKSWLVKGPDGKALPEEEQRSMSADEKRAWIAHHAGQHPDAVSAHKRLREAEQATQAARDELTLADKSLSACRADLDAAIATVQTLALALHAEEQ